MIIDYLSPRSKGKAQPLNPYLTDVGVTAFADGVNWNPLADGVARWVMWTGTAWVAILRTGDVTPPNLMVVNQTNSAGATTYNATGLNDTFAGGAGLGNSYMFEMLVTNGTSNAENISLMVNADQTATNYWTSWAGSGGTQVGTNNAIFWAMPASALVIDGVIQGRVSVTNTQGIVITWLFAETSTRSMKSGATIYTANTTITSLGLLSSVASGIGANSRIRVWKSTP